MKAFRKSGGSRRGALLAAFLLYVFGLLPFLSATHQHETGQGHETCQLCLSSSQALEAPTAPVLALAVSLPVSQLPQEARRALQSLHLERESRGPPSA
jgi:hypothetical protein